MDSYYCGILEANGNKVKTMVQIFLSWAIIDATLCICGSLFIVISYVVGADPKGINTAVTNQKNDMDMRGDGHEGEGGRQRQKGSLDSNDSVDRNRSPNDSLEDPGMSIKQNLPQLISVPFPVLSSFATNVLHHVSLISGVLLLTVSLLCTMIFLPFSSDCPSSIDLNCKGARRRNFVCNFLNRLFSSGVVGCFLGFGQVIAAYAMRKSLNQQIREIWQSWIIGYYALVLTLGMIMYFIILSALNLYQCPEDFYVATELCQQQQGGNLPGQFRIWDGRSSDHKQSVLEKIVGLCVTIFFYLGLYVNITLSFLNIIHSIVATTYLAVLVVAV